MKKITSLAIAILCSLPLLAQDFYKFSTRTATYGDLVSPTSLNNGKSWDTDDFGPVSLPFQFEIFGQKLDEFGFDSVYFYLLDQQGDYFAFFMPISGYLVDRDFSLLGPSQSPISYKVEGATGNRILKLEVKNAGSGFESENNQPSTTFINHQVWLYEADKSIEFHYGNHNITNVNLINDEGVSAVAFAVEDDTTLNGLYLEGTIQNPTHKETNDPDEVPANLGAIPTPNTVYRFEVDPLAIKDQEKIEFSMYPNPVNDVLNLTFTEAVDKAYSVYDLMGREVLKGSIKNTTQAVINVNTLQKGSYILRIAGSTQKFIKK